MKKYDEYKDVQMGWLNKIPIHWTTVSLKFSTGNKPLSFVDGDWIESKVIKSDGIRYLTTGNVGVISYKEQGNGFISEQTFKELNCTEVFSGDILISRLNFPIGRACIVPDLGYRIVVAVDNVIFRPDTTKYNRRYLVYQMNCYPYSENANVLGRGSTMQRITRTQLGAFKLCVPPLPEQVAIASYLDTKCAKIDNLISIQQKRIALLQELKQSVITHAVTKGLNPNVEMKLSGVEWIGDVPKHWEVMPIKYIADTNSGATPKNIKGRQNERSDIKWVRTTDLSDICDYVYDSSEYLSREEMKSASCPWLPKNTVVVAMYGGSGTIGKTGILGCDSTINQALCSLETKKLADYRYLYYNIKSLRPYWMKFAASSRKDPNISQEIIRNMDVPVPGVDEQTKIVYYLDHKCATIDTSISNAQHQIDLLQEYKQSLITEVVTGKRKVTDN